MFGKRYEKLSKNENDLCDNPILLTDVVVRSTYFKLDFAYPYEKYIDE